VTACEPGGGSASRASLWSWIVEDEQTMDFTTPQSRAILLVDRQLAALQRNWRAGHIDWDGKSPEYEMLTNNEWLTITDRSPVLYAVLSIGQILSRSVSAVQFMARVAELDLGPLR